MMRTNTSTPLGSEKDLNSKATIIISCICHIHSRISEYGSVWIELIVAENLKLKTENTVAK